MSSTFITQKKPYHLEIQTVLLRDNSYCSYGITPDLDSNLGMASRMKI